MVESILLNGTSLETFFDGPSKSMSASKIVLCWRVEFQPHCTHAREEHVVSIIPPRSQNPSRKSSIVLVDSIYFRETEKVRLESITFRK